MYEKRTGNTRGEANRSILDYFSKENHATTAPGDLACTVWEALISKSQQDKERRPVSGCARPNANPGNKRSSLHSFSRRSLCFPCSQRERPSASYLEEYICVLGERKTEINVVAPALHQTAGSRVLLSSETAPVSKGEDVC